MFCVKLREIFGFAPRGRKKKNLPRRKNNLKKSFFGQISRASETLTLLFVEFVQFVDKNLRESAKSAGENFVQEGFRGSDWKDRFPKRKFVQTDFEKRQVSEAWSHVASGKSLFAPEARSRMKCGTKITPCGDAAWGCARKRARA